MGSKKTAPGSVAQVGGDPSEAPGANGGGGNGTNTTNSEATRAQGDETVEPDNEATEHDISTQAESIDPNSESQLQVAYFFFYLFFTKYNLPRIDRILRVSDLMSCTFFFFFQTVEEGNDEEFDDMMDQLLDRDGSNDPPILADVIEQSMIDADDTQHDSQVQLTDK